jgi:hypothetical protein
MELGTTGTTGVAVKRVRPAAELAPAAGLTSYMICKLMIS